MHGCRRANRIRIQTRDRYSLTLRCGPETRSELSVFPMAANGHPLITSRSDPPALKAPYEPYFDRQTNRASRSIDASVWRQLLAGNPAALFHHGPSMGAVLPRTGCISCSCEVATH